MTANGGLPHGDHPFSHGIGVRPVTQEVWFLDDVWGYLNVFDTSKTPHKPQFVGRVELFDDEVTYVFSLFTHIFCSLCAIHFDSITI